MDFLAQEFRIENLGEYSTKEGHLIPYGKVYSDKGMFPFIGNQYFTDLYNKNVEQDFYESYFLKLERYNQFIIERSKRPYLDVYAAFQPFNEAFKSLYPFLKIAQEKLAPGKPILNIWDRSGWTTALLLGMFPNNPVYTTWEGNKDILGYYGYAHWFGKDDRLTVVFNGIDEVLPFKENYFELVVGLDAFHRYAQKQLLDQLEKITTDNSAIIFPHVHLSNNEPDPYFDRGCLQRHGMEYQQDFDGRNSKWQGFVLSEPMLFNLNDGHQSKMSIDLQSNPETSDYNGLIALMTPFWQVDKLTAFNSNDIINTYDKDNLRLLVNPLFQIDYIDSQAHLNTENQQLSSLFERHPVYIDRISQSIQLTPDQCIILFLSEQGYTFSEIQEKHGTFLDLASEIASLEGFGIVHCIPISHRHFSMQEFISKQRVIHHNDNLRGLWYETIGKYGNEPYIATHDGSVFSYLEVEEIVNQTRRKLSQFAKKGDRIIILSDPHIEAVVLFWAAVSIGLVIVPVNKFLKKSIVEEIIVDVEPTLVFTSFAQACRFPQADEGLQYVVFDDQDESIVPGYLSFSEWLSQENPHNKSTVHITNDDLAVILYTSGSTGIPKGVTLTHGQLVQSGLNMASQFEWVKEDRYFCSGGLEYMSGLRNMTTAAATVGCSIYIPSPQPLTNAFTIASEMEESSSTILTTNPHLINSLCALPEERFRLYTLRLVLSTGNYLQKDLKLKFEGRFNKKLYNYYGHTETSGICLAQNPGAAIPTDGIGHPVNALVQLVDDNDQVIRDERVGEIRVYSSCISKGYYNQRSAMEVKNGWYYTGDLARIGANGEFGFVNRKKEIFKSPLELIIYFSDVEQGLMTLPGVKTVVAASVQKENIEWMYLFVEATNANEKNNLSEIIEEFIQREICTEKLPLRIIFKNDFQFIHGKINKQLLIDEVTSI